MNVYTLSAKQCMAHLLLKETFDSYSFIEGTITTFNSYTIDGYLQKDFFDEEPADTYSRWKDMRDFVYQIIKGKRTPLNFKFVLSLPPQKFAEFLAHNQLTAYRADDIQGLYLNFHYDGTTLNCITGISLKTFSMDKSLEKVWDSHVKTIFQEAGIEIES